MKTKLEEAAKEYWEANKYKSDYPHCPFSFIDGAKSDATRDYWFKIFKDKFIDNSNGK